jgi:hypothetical protein
VVGGQGSVPARLSNGTDLPDSRARQPTSTGYPTAVARFVGRSMDTVGLDHAAVAGNSPGGWSPWFPDGLDLGGRPRVKACHGVVQLRPTGDRCERHLLAAVEALADRAGVLGRDSSSRPAPRRGPGHRLDPRPGPGLLGARRGEPVDQVTRSDAPGARLRPEESGNLRKGAPVCGVMSLPSGPGRRRVWLPLASPAALADRSGHPARHSLVPLQSSSETGLPSRSGRGTCTPGRPRRA